LAQLTKLIINIINSLIPVKCYGSYLLLRQLLTTPHLADLVTLVIPARSAVPTVVLALTACAFTTPLTLLLDGLLTFTV
jgi:uncharacterized membrane protein